MFVVYVAEAHPQDEWQLNSNREQGVVYDQPQSYAERCTIASDMLEALNLQIPTLVDSMDDVAVTAFAAWPERMFVADARGVIAYAGGAGPFGFDPAEARIAVEALLDQAAAVS